MSAQRSDHRLLYNGLAFIPIIATPMIGKKASAMTTWNASEIGRDSATGLARAWLPIRAIVPP